MKEPAKAVDYASFIALKEFYSCRPNEMKRGIALQKFNTKKTV